MWTYKENKSKQRLESSRDVVKKIAGKEKAQFDPFTAPEKG